MDYWDVICDGRVEELVEEGGGVINGQVVQHAPRDESQCRTQSVPVGASVVER